MKIIVIGFIILLCAAFASISLIPSTTTATQSATFSASIEDVWSVYTDFESQPNWRDELSAIEFSPDKKSWTEIVEPGGIRINISVLEMDAPTKLVLKTGSTNSFEGVYTARFESTEEGTRGTFTETSTSQGFLAKLIRHFLVDQNKIIETYTKNARAELSRRRLAMQN